MQYSIEHFHMRSSLEYTEEKKSSLASCNGKFIFFLIAIPGTSLKITFILIWVIYIEMTSHSKSSIAAGQALIEVEFLYALSLSSKIENLSENVEIPSRVPYLYMHTFNIFFWLPKLQKVNFLYKLVNVQQES